MDNDFIKWMCEKAEGFGFEYRTFDAPARMNDDYYIDTPHDSFKVSQNSPLYRKVYYPLLIQRAIEGVNRTYFNEGSAVYPWIVLDSSHAYKVYYQMEAGPKIEFSWEFPCSSEDIDKAKESALKYIYEQEKI